MEKSWGLAVFGGLVLIFVIYMVGFYSGNQVTGGFYHPKLQGQLIPEQPKYDPSIQRCVVVNFPIAKVEGVTGSEICLDYTLRVRINRTCVSTTEVSNLGGTYKTIVVDCSERFIPQSNKNIVATCCRF